MKFFLPLCLLLTSCGTTISPDGTLSIGGDAENIHYTRTAAGDTTLTIGALSRSQPINAVGGVVKTGIVTWGTAAMLKGTDNIIDSVNNSHLKR
jgi:hypothetical protein